MRRAGVATVSLGDYERRLNVPLFAMGPNQAAYRPPTMFKRTLMTRVIGRCKHMEGRCDCSPTRQGRQIAFCTGGTQQLDPEWRHFLKLQ